MPPGVHAVKSKGKTYFYWHPGRGTNRAGKRVALGDPRNPEFWAKLERERGVPADEPCPAGSWAALDRDYRASHEWARLSDGTRRVYALRLGAVVAAWGKLQVSQTSHNGIVKLRDGLSKTPVSANQLVSVIGAVMKWGSSHGYGQHAVAKGVTPLDPGEIEGAEPWPEWAYEIVRREAPEALRRAAFLGRATGQRRSDLVLMGRLSRRDDGLQFTVKKLRNRKHFLPLLAHELAKIDSWAAPDIGPYITKPNGKPTNGDRLAWALKSFCRSHPRLKEAEVFLHGLRAMAVCDRRMQGLTHQEIASQICMSLAMVMHYSKGIDGELLNRAANARREQKAPRL